MKLFINLLITAVIAVCLASCGVPVYYQMYKAVPTEQTLKNDNYYCYEDVNCKVTYDFWDEGGNIGFRFYNKTDQSIYLNLEQSFLVLNGVAYDYFRNRAFSYSSTSGFTNTKTTSSYKNGSSSASVIGVNYLSLLQSNSIQAQYGAGSTSGVGLIASSGFTVSYNEDKVICIPAKTSKVITEYKITESLFRDCGLLKYPTKKQIKSLKFTKAESPIVFTNRITYNVELSEPIKFENEFYVAEISNYSEGDFLESTYDKYCGEKSANPVWYFKYASPDKFYIKYYMGTDSMKH